jgi:hypothetical protein
MEILSAEPITAAVRGRPKGGVAQIRERHHALARLVAEGLPLAEIGRVVGMTGAGVRAWADNPANAELISQYATGPREALGTFLEARTALRNQAALLASKMIVDQLREACDSGADIPLDKLLRIMADCDDRTGLGRQETHVNMNVDFGSRLAKAIEAKKTVNEVRAAGKSVVVEFARRG